ncbi:4285_t:CDS:1 [Cetraspora pellucida]|uniref:4285_t:CDS:1 n=1 Tax=Cetraspora pellucida TaxID=1433469 RepID=A0A9N8ZDV9_9GLOM|nr:4285_t:CDS:1 [Cetraspora pellucida]
MSRFKKTSKDKEIVKKANIQGKVKEIGYFDANNQQFALIINKVAGLYAIRLIKYEIDNTSEKVIINVRAVKRFPNLMEFYPNKEEAYTNFKEIQVKPELISQCINEIETHDDETENNILLIGVTGSGKSTLANVISNTDEFNESDKWIGGTQQFKTMDFEWNGTKYRVVDTVGTGDTNLSKDEVLYKMGEAIHSMKKGIRRIFVLIGSRLNNDTVEPFNYIQKIFKNVDQHITIIRTGFKDFQDKKACEQDKSDIEKTNNKMATILKRYNIIYVNNPPNNKQDRENSRKIIMSHLESCGENYKMDNWDNVCVRINDLMIAKKWGEENNNKNTAKKLRKEIISIVNEQIGEQISQSLNEMIQKEREAVGEVRVNVQGTFFGDAEVEMKLKNLKNCCSIL